MISPLASVTGMLQAITIAPTLGGQATLESRFDDVATFDLLIETGGTFFGGPDLLLDRVLDEADRRGVTQVPLTTVYLGGSMLDPRILARAEHEFGIVVLRAYGSSEAPVSTSGARDESESVRLGDDGRPLRGVEVRIGSQVDPAECCIGGAHLFLGYVDADDDAGAFDDGGGDDDWFRTGDLAELRDGRLRITGRIKDIVIRNGLNIPIAEVDGLVAALPGVVHCAGYGVTDDATGERLVMAVRLRPGADLPFDVHGRRTRRCGAREVEDPGRARCLGRAVSRDRVGQGATQPARRARRRSTPHARVAPAATDAYQPDHAYHRITKASVLSISSIRSAIISAERSGSVMPVVMPRNSRDTRPPPTE